MSDSLPAPVEAVLGERYRVTRALKGGGMSQVFLADDRVLQRRVVLKLLAPTGMPWSTERFRREIAIAAVLQHPNIVPLLDAGEAGDFPWYVMPYVEGESLRNRLEGAGPGEGGALPIAEVIRLLRDIARALAYAHRQGVVHRDIKPENVLLVGGAAQVTDFGIARAIAAGEGQEGASADPRVRRLTSVGLALGTPAYMAPEQAMAAPEVGPAADLYALGVLAYELLSGSPFEGAGRFQAAPAPLRARRPEVPARLEGCITRWLELDPALRGTADEALDALEGITEQQAPERKRRWRRRSWGLAALLLVLLGVTGYLLLPTLGGWVMRRSVTRAAARGLESVVVLPVTAPGGDSAGARIVAGLDEEIAVAMAKLPFLTVLRPADLGGDDREPVRRRAGQAGARYLLQGRLLPDRRGDELVVRFTLSRAEDGSITWEDREGLRRERGGGTSLALTLSDRIRPLAEPAAGAGALRGATRDPEAWRAYLQATALLRTYFRYPTQAAALLRQAVGRDSAFTLAWGTLALAEAVAIRYAETPLEHGLALAQKAAERAAALDSGLGTTLMARGQVALLRGEGEATLALFQRALSAGATGEDTYSATARLLAASGARDSALAVLERWSDSEPLSASTALAAALVALQIGAAERIQGFLELARERDPSQGVRQAAQSLGAAARALLGDRATAARMVSELSAESMSPLFEAAALWPVAVVLGDRAMSRRLLSQLDAGAARFGIPRARFAIWAAALAATAGRRDEALVRLGEARRANALELITLELDPLLASVRQ